MKGTFGLLLWVVCCMKIAAPACEEGPTGYQFGQSCAFKCRCLLEEQCHQTSGECISGCEPGWMGPGCQYANIAFNKTATQRSTLITNTVSFTAGLAVDSDVTTCGQTTIIRDTWWRVDLGAVHYIVGMLIVLSDNDARPLTEFHVRVSNSSGVGTNYALCYQSPTGDNLAQTTAEILCYQPVRGRYVDIYIPGRLWFLHLCEVQIYGGRELAYQRRNTQSTTARENSASSFAFDGSTADDTTFTCSQTQRVVRAPFLLVDLGQMFHISRLVLYNRLNVNARAQLENFEIDINSNLSFVEDNRVYAHSGSTDERRLEVILPRVAIGRYVRVHIPITQRILMLCELQIFGDCPPGVCGLACSEKCWCNSTTTGVAKIEGVCPYGCANRTMGREGRCDTKCADSNWGPDCAHLCGKCWNSFPCDVTTGWCTKACEDGFQSMPFCLSGCEDGFHGVNCDKTCGRCYGSEACNRTDGTCTNCEPGRLPPNCENACSFGNYGINCRDTCGRCVGGGCNVVSGVCETGCQQGWVTNRCDLEKGHADLSSAGYTTETVTAISLGVVGIIILLVVIAVGGFCICRKWSKRKQERHYQGNQPAGNNNATPAQQNPANNVVNGDLDATRV